MRQGRPDTATLIAFLVAVLMLGANWVGVRFSNRELPPFWGAALRFAIASAILFAIVAARGIAIPRGRALLGAALFGLGQYFATFALIYWALVVLPAGMTSVIFATLPLFTLFLAAAAGVPPHLRTLRYWAMPVLHGDAIVGSVDPRFERARGELVVNKVVLARGAPLSAAGAIKGAVAELAEWLGAERVRWP